jgi:hypothetical protein
MTQAREILEGKGKGRGGRKGQFCIQGRKRRDCFFLFFFGGIRFSLSLSHSSLSLSPSPLLPLSRSPTLTGEGARGCPAWCCFFFKLLRTTRRTEGREKEGKQKQRSRGEEAIRSREKEIRHLFSLSTSSSFFSSFLFFFLLSAQDAFFPFFCYRDSGRSSFFLRPQ